MGLDAPTTTCVSSATSSSNFSLQQTSFVDTFTNVDSSKKDSEKEKEQQHKQILATTSSSISGHSSTFVQSTNVDCGGQQQNDDITSDNFPEDLSGLDGISPIVDLSLTGNGRAQNSGGNCNAKVEFFGFGPTSLATPASTNGHHHPQQQLNVLYSQQNLLQQQQFNGPGSAPAGPSCCSSADSGHHSAGGSVPGGTSVDFFRCPSSSSSSNLLNHCHQNIDQQQKLIIRNPFAPEYPPKAFSQISNLSPLNGHHQHFCDQQQLLQPVMQPLNWDGKPPNDSKCMAELARLADADPLKPPMVPLPNVKEGGIPHGGVFPQWSFFNMPFVSVK
uniref:Uncharacterized protein n=1 Tax=Meloidogyne hapla TaxID=6305 RepID=A0A1I8BSG8_MELHA